MAVKWHSVFSISLLPVCSAALVITGCERDRNWGVPAPDTSYTAGPAADRNIKKRVQDALRDDPAYEFPNVKVTIEDAQVVLSGTVETTEQRERAGHLAAAVTKGPGVANRITVIK
jgi:osmotically-inducible protein OsmY